MLQVDTVTLREPQALTVTEGEPLGVTEIAGDFVIVKDAELQGETVSEIVCDTVAEGGGDWEGYTVVDWLTAALWEIGDALIKGVAEFPMGVPVTKGVLGECVVDMQSDTVGDALCEEHGEVLIDCVKSGLEGVWDGEPLMDCVKSGLEGVWDEGALMDRVKSGLVGDTDTEPLPDGVVSALEGGTDVVAKSVREGVTLTVNVVLSDNDKVTVTDGVAQWDAVAEGVPDAESEGDEETRL